MMTSLAAWIAVDHHGPTALYMASDSRITWGSQRRRWDAGKKLFCCRRSADIFGYCGEVVFPSQLISQVVELADEGYLFGREAAPEERHNKIVEVMHASHSLRHNTPEYDFQIMHASRYGNGMDSTFFMWQTTFTATGKVWSDLSIMINPKDSMLVTACGTGAGSIKAEYNTNKGNSSSLESRLIFSSICDAIRSEGDSYSGGAPQLVGIYRGLLPRYFGVLYKKTRFFQGLPVQSGSAILAGEWRDELFQRVDGETLALVEDAQRHTRPRRR